MSHPLRRNESRRQQWWSGGKFLFIRDAVFYLCGVFLKYDTIASDSPEKKKHKIAAQQNLFHRIAGQKSPVDSAARYRVGEGWE